MEVWKIIFLSKWVICRFHVNLVQSDFHDSKVVPTHPDIAHQKGNPPCQLWKNSLKRPFGKGCSGCVPKVCWNNLWMIQYLGFFELIDSHDTEYDSGMKNYYSDGTYGWTS